ncbi:uncharacterized protein [Macrobrachium rosenbergii]|uniref:uncharacterized protein n=1 Tax=Macrobrachium rosenbergii TaxID=79674 RepID=UPI0034D61571
MMASLILEEELPLMTPAPSRPQRKCFQKRYALFVILIISVFFFYAQNITVNTDIDGYAHMAEAKEKVNTRGNKTKHRPLHSEATEHGNGSAELLSTVTFHTSNLEDELSKEQNDDTHVASSFQDFLGDPESVKSLGVNREASTKDDRPIVSFTSSGISHISKAPGNITFGDATKSGSDEKNTNHSHLVYTTNRLQETSTVVSIGIPTTKVNETTAALNAVHDSKGKPSSGYKLILFYTKFFGGPWSNFLRNRRTDLAHHGCPVHQCLFTFDRSEVSKADALIFHATGYDPNDLPEIRHPHQRYIWMNVEAPCLDQRTSNEPYHGKPGFFNWTATYHRESEVLIAYGGLVPKEGDTMPSRLSPIDRNSGSYRKYMEVLSKRVRLYSETNRTQGLKDELASGITGRSEDSNNKTGAVDELLANRMSNRGEASANRTLDRNAVSASRTLGSEGVLTSQSTGGDEISANKTLNRDEVSANRTRVGESSHLGQNSSFFSRPKLVAWMVSHCNTVSGREIYINELKKYIPVDIYGSCGSLKCGRNHLDTFCYADLLRPTYKFYLAFENSWCQDYITEKVFLPLEYGLVPVVYGGAKFEDFLPPHSYVDASTMSPRALARKLTRIASSDAEYATYHLWRNYWSVVVPVPFCDLCRRLHTDVTEAHIPDLGRWWGDVNNCTTRYPESQYPRPKFIDAHAYLKSLGEGLWKVGSVLGFLGR